MRESTTDGNNITGCSKLTGSYGTPIFKKNLIYNLWGLILLAPEINSVGLIVE